LKRRTACFFVKTPEEAALERTEFYTQDLRILRELGFEVKVATSLRELVVADLYFCWWWTWAFVPVALARALRRPVLVTGVFDLHEFDRRPASHRALMRYALRAAGANVFLSRLEEAQVTRTFKVARPHYIPVGVDTNVYRPNGRLREDLILTVAWLQAGNAERKGVPDAIRAVNLLRRRRPGVRLVVAGEKASGYPQLRRLADSLGAGDSVAFLGAIPRQEKIELMQRCKVYIQPSQFEGFGVAVLEAMSCGSAVLTRPVGAIPEVVGDAGLLVGKAGVEALEEGLRQLFDDTDLRSELGRRARVRAETVFPYARRKRELAELIHQLSSGRS
jgi:glycosyltransferase involved in cell wall biosynthesis